MPYLTLIGLLLIAGAVISRLKLVPPNILPLILGGAILIAAVAWAVSSAKPRKDNAGNQTGSGNDNKAPDSGPEDSKSPPNDEPPKTPPPAPEKPAGIDIGRTFGKMILWLIPIGFVTFIVCISINDIRTYWIHPQQNIQGAISQEKWTKVQDLDFSKNFHNENGKSWTTRLAITVKLKSGTYRTDATFNPGDDYHAPGTFEIKKEKEVYFVQDKSPRATLWKKS